MPTPFSAERFYALTGRSAPVKTVSQTPSQTLPEVNVVGSAQLREDAFMNNSGELLYEVYENLCNAEHLYAAASPEYSDINRYSDVRRINAATSFCEASAYSSLLQSLISGQKISYENQIMTDIINNSSGVVMNQDLQYLQNSAKKIKQYSNDIQKENNQKLTRFSNLENLLLTESRKQGISIEELQTLSPEGQAQLKVFLEQAYKESLTQRQKMENAHIQSPEYQNKLAQIREQYDVEKAPQMQENLLMRQAALSR